MIRARHLRMGGRFLAHRLNRLHPYEVQALLLNACNLKCAYCRCPEIRTTVMTTEQWRSTVRQLGALGTLRIKFQGGEPTLRADFAELCVEAQQAGMITAVITNGIRIAAEPQLLNHVDEMVVSLDSVSPVFHDRQRGQGTHEQAVRAIDAGRRRGLRMYVVMVMHRENWPELEPMLDFCEARGVGLHAQPIVFGREAFDDGARDLALTDEQMRDMHTRLAEWKRQGRGLMFSARTYQKVAVWPDYEIPSTRSQGVSKCMAGKYYIHIEPNGDVWPCGQHGESFTPKNLIVMGWRKPFNM